MTTTIESLKRGIISVGKVLSDNSPTILTGLGVAGVFATAIFAADGHLKAVRLLDDEYQRRLVSGDGDGVHDINFEDRIKITWQCYIPAATMAAATVACIIGANALHIRRQAVLASLYKLAEDSAKRYQEKVKETLGEGKAQKISDEIAQDKLNENPIEGATIHVTGKGNTLCYDALSGRYFLSDLEVLRQAQNTFNHSLLSDRFQTLNELYYEMGLEPIKLGQYSGWTFERLLEFHFTAKITTSGDPCIVVDYHTPPTTL